MDKQASLTCIGCDHLAIIEGSYKCCNTDGAECLNEKPFEPKNLPLKILKVKFLGPGWKTVREHSEPRNTYKDPFMQHIRDKLDLLSIARKCVEGRELVFGTLFLDAQESISKRENTDDMFYWEQHNYMPGSTGWEAGAKAVSIIVNNDGKTLSAGIYIQALNADEEQLDEDTYEIWRAAGYIGNVNDNKLFGQIVKEEAEKKSNADKP